MTDSEREEGRIRDLEYLDPYRSLRPCPACRGERLKPESLAVRVKGGSDRERQWLQANRHYLTTLARTSTISTTGEAGADDVIALAGDMSLLVALKDVIDPQAESARLRKELDRLRSDAGRLNAKLGNASFVDRAPEAVVQKERDRLKETEAMIGKLEEQHRRIAGML